MPQVKNIAFDLGRADATDPRHAPFGSVRTVRNLRHRKGGRLGLRNGYVASTMTTRDYGSGTQSLKAYDLFCHQGRLHALGSDASTPDAFPIDVYERINGTTIWRATSATAQTTTPGYTLHPFVGLREVGNTPQLDGGAVQVRSAAGAGHLCTVTTSTGTPNSYQLLIIRESDDAVIYQEVNTSYTSGQVLGVCFSVDSFYILVADAVRYFTPGTSTIPLDLGVTGLNASATVGDIRPVQNPTTARIVVAIDQGATTDLSVLCFSSAGAQIGTTCTVAATTTVHISAQADQTANRIGLLTVEAAAAVRLRTFNLTSGALVLGPTAASVTGLWAELAMYASGTTYAVAIVEAAGNDTVVETYTVAAHALSSSKTIGRFILTTQLIPWTSTNIPQAVVFGGVSYADAAALPTNGLVYWGISNTAAHVAWRDYLNARVNSGVGISCGLSIDSSTGRACWSALRDTGGGDPVPVHTTFAYQSARRRQTVSAGGLTYLAQGNPGVYDGRILVDVGFSEAPAIVSLTASNGTGSLTNSASYDYQVVWSYTLADGQYYQSAPSQLASVTMGAADDTVAVVLKVPHALLMLVAARYGGDVTAEVYRTVWDATAGAKGAIFRLTGTLSLDTPITAYGDAVTFTDRTSDANLADDGVIYTQGARGPLSGPLEHNAPRASEYVAATESRLLWGGQPRRFEFQVSKEAFLGEPFSHSEFSSFFGQVHAPIYAVAALGETKYVFTSEEIYAVQGTGPDDTGSGVLGAPVRLPVPSGLKADGWRSLLETPQGLFFQLDSNKLYRLNGMTPEWVGVDVQDTLASYPDVSGTARSRADSAALFACQNTGATDARILVYDLERGTWLEDTPPLTASSGIAALCTYGRTVAYATGGNVYVQSESGFTDGSSSPITAQLVTNPLYPFGLGGYGLILEALLSFEFRGACDLAARVSYDDGVSYTTLPTFTLTGSAGQSMRRKWTLPQSDATSVVFEFTVTPTGTGTEGIAFANLALATIASAGLGEPDPADCA
jgi:hypothetical protein